MEDAPTYAQNSIESGSAAPPLTGAAGEGETPSLMQQALAGLPSDTNLRATFQGQAGFWCQADAVFIPSDFDDAAGAVWAYRHRLTSGNIGVNHNLHTGSIQCLRAEADLASARARLQEETRAAAEARERAAELMAGLLMEWMDETEPHSLTYDNPDEFLKDQGVHRKFFQLKAAACGLGWPLHEATIGISAALPLVGEEGKEGVRS